MSERHVPKFPLPVLEALEDWRSALRDRATGEAERKAATTPHTRASAVQRIDKASVRAGRARRALEEALRLEAEEG